MTNQFDSFTVVTFYDEMEDHLAEGCWGCSVRLLRGSEGLLEIGSDYGHPTRLDASAAGWSLAHAFVAGLAHARAKAVAQGTAPASVADAHLGLQDAVRALTAMEIRELIAVGRALS